VVLHYGTSEAIVSVTDDGRGAATALGGSALSGAPNRYDETSGAGHGLEGMRERVSLLGGTVRTAPCAGGGFEVSATVPYGVDGAGTPWQRDVASPQRQDEVALRQDASPLREDASPQRQGEVAP